MLHLTGQSVNAGFSPLTCQDPRHRKICHQCHASQSIWHDSPSSKIRLKIGRISVAREGSATPSKTAISLPKMQFNRKRSFSCRAKSSSRDSQTPVCSCIAIKQAASFVPWDTKKLHAISWYLILASWCFEQLKTLDSCNSQRFPSFALWSRFTMSSF